MSDETKYTAGERDELIEAKEQRAKKYGIKPKPGTPLTPPAGYPQDEEEYGDPVNYKYPIDEEHIRPALSYFNQFDQRERGGYTLEEWAIIGERIAAAASRLLDARYEYRDGRVVRAEEEKALNAQHLDTVYAAAHKSLKVVSETQDALTVEGWGIVFGGQDLVGDTFVPDTDLWLKHLPLPRPVLFEHGFDIFGAAELGKAYFEQRDAGWWVQAVLDRHNRYVQMVEPLIRSGVLGWSTGSAEHLVEREGGVIRRWPVVEISLTATPAEPRTLGITEVRTLAGSIPALKSLLDDNEHGQQKELIREEPKMNDIEIRSLVESVVEETIKRVSGAPGLLLTGTAEERGEHPFKTYLRTGRWPAGVKAPLVVGTGAQGGFLVPDEYAREVIQPLTAASVMRQIGVRMINVNTDVFRLPVIQFSSRAQIIGEGVAYEQAEPTFAEVVFNLYKFGRIARASEEYVSDTQFDTWREVLQPDFTQAFAAAENHFFAVGTGSGQPQGITVGGTIGVTTAANNAITGDEVINLFHALAPEYRTGAVWVMNDATARVLRSLKETTGQYLWQPGLREGVPDLLLGRPVYTSSSMPTIAANARVIAFGHPQYYGVAMRAGLTVQRLDELYAANGYVGYAARMRWDGRVLLSSAWQLLRMAA